MLAPAVAEGRVFTGGGFSRHEFYCLSAETGRALWSVRLSDNGPSSTAYDQRTVIFTTESCTCYALDAVTGNKLWSVWLGDPIVSTPTIAGDRVLVAYPGSGGSGPARPATSSRPGNCGPENRSGPSGSTTTSCPRRSSTANTPTSSPSRARCTSSACRTAKSVSQDDAEPRPRRLSSTTAFT